MSRYKNTSKSKHTGNRKKHLVVAVIVVILLIAGYVFWQRSNADKNLQTTVNTESETINFTPPTEDEQQSTDNNKQRIIDEQENPQNNPTPPNGQRQVSVLITSADKQAVFASVSGVVEDGGICTATFSNGSATLSASSESIANVSYTQCGRIQPPVLDGGNWSVTVSYRSATANGSSEPFRME